MEMGKYSLSSILPFRCSWNGESCNVDLGFRTILTDLGVCYTFNNEERQPLMATENGQTTNVNNVLLKDIYVLNKFTFY